jgi:hypothetical protein
MLPLKSPPALPVLLPFPLDPKLFLEKRLIADITAQDPLRSTSNSPFLRGSRTGLNTQNGMSQVSTATRCPLTQPRFCSSASRSTTFLDLQLKMTAPRQAPYRNETYNTPD